MALDVKGLQKLMKVNLRGGFNVLTKCDVNLCNS